MLALVKWLSGKDKGKFTAGVPVDWLRDFDKATWLSNKEKDEEESYICEWRDAKKEPAGGWDVHDAQVIEVSGKYSLYLLVCWKLSF